MTQENNARTDSPLRVGVIGMGPVGSIIAAHLQDAGAFVVPCEVDPTIAKAIKSKGITLTHAIEKHVEIPNIAHSIHELAVFDPDVVIVATKTPVLQKVVASISEIDNGALHVLVAQNGIDNEQIVARVVGEERTSRMVINFAGVSAEPNIVHVSFFNPPNYIAALLMHGEQMVDRIVALFNSVNLFSEVPHDIQDHVWEKAILNAALSPVCAITRRTMKDVLDFPQGQELIEAIIDESVRVATAEGLELDKKFRRFSLRYLKNAGHHRPSMLTDLEAGRRTEIDQLNGCIAEYGKKHHIPTPLNLSIAEIVRMLERNGK